MFGDVELFVMLVLLIHRLNLRLNCCQVDNVNPVSTRQWT